MTVGTWLTRAARLGLGVAALTGCGNACEDYVDAVEDRFHECGYSAFRFDPYGGECTDAMAAQAECLTPCIDEATCGALVGGDAEGFAEYAECAGACLPPP